MNWILYDDVLTALVMKFDARTICGKTISYQTKI